MAQRTPEERAEYDRWFKESVVHDLYEGGRWNPANTQKWLSEQTPAVWHELALNFNWGSPGVEPLRAIVEFNDCDRATAMSVFALAAPDYYEGEFAEGKTLTDFDGIDREIVDLLDAIGDGFYSGRYNSDTYKCAEDPAGWEAFYKRRAAQGEPIRWRLPPRAFKPTQGLDHNPEYVLVLDQFRVPFDRWRQ
jgi:Domain of unknown function (DUF4274)